MSLSAKHISETRTGLAANQEVTEAKQSAGIRLAVIGLLWVILVGTYCFVALRQGTQLWPIFTNALILLALFMPLVFMWLSARLLGQVSALHTEILYMKKSYDGMRRMLSEQQRMHRPAEDGREDEAITKKLDEIAEVQQETKTALSSFISARAKAEALDETSVPENASTHSARQPGHTPAPKVITDKDPAAPELDFGTPEKLLGAKLSRKDFVRAIDFPKTADDSEGFEALRRALKDREAGQMVQAAQDVLTLFSEIGIYMDDIHPDRPKPELWRRFAEGERGRPVGGLGAIHDKDLLENVTLQMRNDPVFRDAAHHFLRVFDKTLLQFEREADDAELQNFGDTRTSRAFMILARVAGTFD